MYWHWQNLNTHSDSYKPKGSGFWHGRAWFYLTDKLTFEPSWSFGKHAGFTHLELRKDCADGNKLTLAIGLRRLFSIWLTIEGLPFIHSKSIYDEEREIGISYHHNIIWLAFWSDSSGFGPRREWNFNVERFIFGRSSYSEENTTPEQAVIIHMPERDYTAQVRFYDGVWRYKRFRKPRRVRRANIAFDRNNLIYFAGKGENSWDLDDDAYAEMTVSGMSTLQEVQKYVFNSIMKRRQRYGLPANLTEHQRILNENALTLLEK